MSIVIENCNQCIHFNPVSYDGKKYALLCGLTFAYLKDKVDFKDINEIVDIPENCALKMFEEYKTKAG